MNILPVLIIVALIALAAAALFFLRDKKFRKETEQRERDLGHKMYELSILKELGERVGYSLNIAQIADIITGSLHQFIEYSVVSSLLIEPEKLVFKAHLERSVSRAFVDEVKERMLKSLSALLNKPLEGIPVDELVSGAILADENSEPVRSYFNIPLVIGIQIMGILTVAHTKTGLYKDEEMTLLYKITGQASQAVKRLQEVVQTEERKINSMVESVPEGVVMTDKDYRVVVANPASRRVAGLPAGTEPTIFDFIDHLQGTFDIRGRLEESVKLDKAVEVPEVVIREHYYRIVVTPVKNFAGMQKGEILGGVVVFHDITKEKELERVRNDFTSMLVHELRSPLDGIQKMTDLVMRRGATMDPKKFTEEYAPIIFKSSSDMLQLVNSLLDVAKLEAGKFEIHASLSNIRTLAEERLRFYAASADARHLVLRGVFDPTLPKEAPFDPGAVTQIFDNFISNGLKFAKSEITISCLLHRAGQKISEEASRAGLRWLVGDSNVPPEYPDCLVVGVGNDGPHIPPSEAQELFNKFKQFRIAAMERKGTGLGLAISKGLAEAHKGMVGVASQEGAGATFYFTLPLVLQ